MFQWKFKRNVNCRHVSCVFAFCVLVNQLFDRSLKMSTAARLHSNKIGERDSLRPPIQFENMGGFAQVTC